MKQFRLIKSIFFLKNGFNQCRGFFTKMANLRGNNGEIDSSNLILFIMAIFTVITLYIGGSSKRNTVYVFDLNSIKID